MWREAVVVTAEDLHKPNSAFEESSGNQTFATEELGFGFHIDFRVVDSRPLWGEAVHILNMLRLLRKVQCIRRAELHSGCEFV